MSDFLARTYPEAVDELLLRRSVKAVEMREPGPDEATLARIIEAGIRVPDHGKLGPWRFLRFQGAARAAFGELLATRFQVLNPEASAQDVQIERSRFLRAPVVVAVISSITPGHKIPVWEQQLSAGAACQNMLVAATLLGCASQWLTEWYAYDEVISDKLGLNDTESVAGYIYLGSAGERPAERPRPTPARVVSDWNPSH